MAGQLVNDRHFDAECRDHRGVLQPDDACPDHDHVARDARGLPELIRIHHFVAKRDFRRARRARAAGDEDVVCLQGLRSLCTFHLQRVQAGKAGRAVNQGHSIASELISDDGRLSGDDHVHAFGQVGDADLSLSLKSRP
jgi:hypothetical protein